MMSVSWKAGLVLVAATISAGVATAAEGINGKVITIGISNIESGSSAIYKPFGQAVRYYLLDRNKTGGVAGYTFDVSVLDNQLTPAGGAQNVRQFLNEDKFAIVLVGTPSAAGAMSVLDESGATVPVITTGATALVRKFHAEGKLKNIYGEFPAYDYGALFDLQYMIKDLGKKKVAIVYEDTALGQGAGALGPDFAKKAGATSVEAIAISPTSTNLSPVAVRLKEAGVEAAEVTARVGLTVALQKAAAAIGYSPVWMTLSSSLTKSYLDLAGDVAEGTYVQSFLLPLSDETNPAVASFKKKIMEVDPKYFDENAQAGWEIGEVIAAAVEKATENGKKDLTRAAFLKAMNSFNGEPIGMSQGVGYTEAEHSSMATSLAIYQVQKGKFVKVSDPRPIPTP